MKYNDEKYNYKTGMFFAFIANTHFRVLVRKNRLANNLLGSRRELKEGDSNGNNK